MRISIIPQDKKIIVDGRTVDLDDDAPWSFDDDNIHAIQWRDGRGELEYEDILGEDPVPNKVFGEDEFQDIIEPYLQYYHTFLDEYEQRELQAALQEEENLANQIEELNLDKLEKEAQLTIIEDLQRQNKELRDERDDLYEEKSKADQALVYEKQTALMELEREKTARESEKVGLEAQKADEFFEKKSLELSKKYEELYHDFEKEKEAFIEERKQYQELLQMEREKMEREEDESMRQLALEDEERKQKALAMDKVRMIEEEELEITKMELALQRQALEITEQENNEVKDEILLARQRIQDTMEMEREQFERQKEQELEIIMRAHEDLLKKMEVEEAYDELDDSVEREFEKAEVEYKKIQREKIAESQSDFRKDEEIEIIRSNTERQKIENSPEKSIDEILTLMDDIDPEKLFTVLTDSEREENDFPVDKAVKWFATLKEVLDKNS